MLFNFSRGVDHTQLECLPERKSIGVEVNWGIRFTDRAKAARFFTFVCVELANRIYQVLYWG
jgi:DNA repair protein REV1